MMATSTKVATDFTTDDERRSAKHRHSLNANTTRRLQGSESWRSVKSAAASRRSTVSKPS